MCLSLCQSLWLHCEHNLRCVCPCVNHCGCSVLLNGRCFSIAAIREGALWQQGMRRFEGCHGLQLIVCVLRSPSAGLSEVGLLWCGPVVQCDRYLGMAHRFERFSGRCFTQIPENIGTHVRGHMGSVAARGLYTVIVAPWPKPWPAMQTFGTPPPQPPLRVSPGDGDMVQPLPKPQPQPQRVPPPREDVLSSAPSADAAAAAAASGEAAAATAAAASVSAPSASVASASAWLGGSIPLASVASASAWLGRVKPPYAEPRTPSCSPPPPPVWIRGKPAPVWIRVKPPHPEPRTPSCSPPPQKKPINVKQRALAAEAFVAAAGSEQPLNVKEPLVVAKAFAAAAASAPSSALPKQPPSPSFAKEQPPPPPSAGSWLFQVNDTDCHGFFEA